MAKAKNWAIVVGINQYTNIGKLKYANRDAEAMAAFFRSAGFDRVFCFADELEIQRESDQLSTMPRSSDLVDFLHDRFTMQEPPLKPGDNCWFFFAGHGKRIKDRDCLLPIDYNPRVVNHEVRAIPVEDVREALLKSGADNVILLLDACRTEGDRDGDNGIGDIQPGTITIFSCQRNQNAYEIDELRHGAFTAALLEGLGMPKIDGNCATVQKLEQYLNHRVPDLCKLHPEQPVQIPNILVEGSKRCFLLLPQSATQQDINSLKMEAFKAVQLEKNLSLAEQYWRLVVSATGGEDSDAISALQDIAVQKALAPKKSTLQPPSLSLTLTTGQSELLPSPPPKPPSPVPKPPSSASKLQNPKIFSFEVITVDTIGREIHRQASTARYFREDIGNGVYLDMVQIPNGSFLMGAVKGKEAASDEEYPQHSVTVPGFWMGMFAVTQAQWQAITALPKVNIDLKSDPSNFKGAMRPVEQVSWQEAIEFCDRLSRKTKKAYRLPSEAEWEYACRAGTTTPFHFGETIVTNLVNFDGNYNYSKAPKGEWRRQTIDVGKFPPNAFGLYDMHGNVWEWCLDTWHSNYDRAPNDGSAWIDKNSFSRLVRGGSWYVSPLNCRSANRVYFAPASHIFEIGFRVVCLPS